MKIAPQLIQVGEPLMCTTNVEKRISALGGSKCFGWLVKDRDFYWERNAQCIWRSPEGELRDVTPYATEVQDDGDDVKFEAEYQEIEFEIDENLTFGHGDCPAPRLDSKTPNPKIDRALEHMAVSEMKLRDSDLPGSQYHTHKANDWLRRAGIRGGWDVPVSLNVGDYLKMGLA